MAAQLQLRLFGAPKITLDGQPITGFVSNKAQALLIYLAVTGYAHKREVLADLFWKRIDKADNTPSANLNKALSNLRKLIGNHLDAEPRQSVCLRPDHCWIDVVEFVNSIGPALARRDVQQLQSVIKLYQDDFLRGFFVKDDNKFENWMLEEQERLQQLLLNALDTLAQDYADSGDLAQAIAYTDRQLKLQPDRQKTLWQLIEWCFRDGQVSKAQRSYQDWRKLQQEDLHGLPAKEIEEFLNSADNKFNDLLKQTSTQKFADHHQPVRAASNQRTSTGSQETSRVEQRNPEQRFALPLHTVPTPTASLPRRSLMSLERNRLFVGREQDLRDLAAALNGDGIAAISQVETAAATGLGGIGKTQLACEFVYRYGQFFTGGVFWLSFADAQAIPTEIAACGGVGRLDLRPDFGQRPLNEQVQLVQAAWQEPVPRLLIFDNCEDPQLLVDWRPKSGGCRVLLTSRRGDWEPALDVKILALDVLRRHESRELLAKHRSDMDAEVMDAIAEELGDLPLALHLAGNYLKRYEKAIKPTEYLAQLRDQNLLQHPSFQGGGISLTKHVQHVGRTFALSYDRLDATNATDDLALKLLTHAAYLALGEPIWSELLVKTVGLDPNNLAVKLQVEAAFIRLIDLGLVTLGRDDIRRLHRLVAAFVREVAHNETEAIQKVIEAAVYKEMAKVNQDNKPRLLLDWQTHLRAVVDTAKVRGDKASASLCNELGQHLWQIGDYQGAFHYYEKALTIRQKILGEEDPDTAQSLNRMGYVLQSLGELSKARPYFERALTVREMIFGEAHEDTAESLNDWGGWLFAQGQWSTARPYFERALRISCRVSGEDHPLTAEYVNNLGSCLLSLDDREGALPYLQQAVAINEKKLGLEHPDTALSLNNVGFLLVKLGRLAAARLYYTRALAIRRNALGDKHPDTGQTLNNLGALACAEGKWEEAQHYLKQALAIYEHALEQTHPALASCFNNLGLLQQAMGKLDQARIYFERALAIRRIALGNGHVDTALSLHNLGMALLAQGDQAKARACLTEALAIRRIVLGEEHRLTLETRNGLDRIP